MLPTEPAGQHHLHLRMAEIITPQGGLITAVEISAPRPRDQSLAIVLDLSDSCGSLRRVIDSCPALVASLPAAWPLWIYRLSGIACLDEVRGYRVADLCEKRVWLTSFVEMRNHAEAGSVGGSFIRPVMEAVDKRRMAQGIDSVVMLVLTDGELLDSSPVHVPQELKVIGIAPPDAAKWGNWSRVLPGKPLHGMTDRALDAAFQNESSPFFGWCKIE
ncbi:MAG: hypothetical protein GXY83_17420 [Rhodopirellula sp.]|nr:hypothetical protein [Rhodopirellula sp.]